MSDGYCIVNSGDKIGLGVPEIEIIDGLDVNQYFGMYTEWSGVRVGSNGSGYIVDYDGDGNNDEVLIPLSDINGDGVGEYGWLPDMFRRLVKEIRTGEDTSKTEQAIRRRTDRRKKGRG